MAQYAQQHLAGALGLGEVAAAVSTGSTSEEDS